jgi:Leucine-rich repeat (LRR) protein
MSRRILTWIVLLVLLFPAGLSPVAAHQDAAVPPPRLATELCDTQTSLPVSECEALVTFYNSTGGPDWTNNTGWLTAPDPCSWYGVVCNSGHVIELSYWNNHLVGGIPAALQDLPYLRYLNFDENQLTGNIPEAITELVYLEEIRMHINQLSGSIPPGVSNLHYLTYFDLQENQLTGYLPEFLGSQLSLEFISLHNNQLSGPIPPSYGDLTQLVVLGLGGNQLTGPIPATLGNLNNLITLGLQWNQLTGSIPESLGNLSSVEDINLGINQLSGSLPASLGNMTQVREIHLYDNDFSGPLPATFGNLTNLTVLRIEDNLLDGNLPAILGSLVNLQELRLNENLFNGSIPTTLGNLAQLRVLDLGVNQLSGEIPSVLGNLTNLEFLALGANQLTGPIPATFGNLTNLTQLGLAVNQLSGGIPSGLGNLSALQELKLHENQLSGSIPASLGSLSSLRVLSLDSNQLSGLLPPELGNLTSLEQLNLSYNQFSGGIPTGLGNLSNLWLLILRSCGLSGPIPVQLGNLSQLQILELGGNELTGSLPGALGNLTNLESLSVWGNYLTGPLPPELGNLTNLISLDVSANAFSGEVPANITNLVNLYDYLDLNPTWWHLTSFGYNMLTANDPATLAFLIEKDAGDWPTQTVPPTNLQVASAVGAVELTWTPIEYTADGGYYEVRYATDPPGPYQIHGYTSSKAANTYMANGLTSGITYYFKLSTYTPAHAGMFYDPYQKSALVSASSEIVSATPSYAPPQAGFSALPVSGTVALDVAFTNLSSGEYSTCSWDFGDNQTSDLCNPLHTYQTTGVFSVSLTVTGPGGSSQVTQADLIAVGAAVEVAPETGGELVYTESSGSQVIVQVPPAAVADPVSLVFSPVVDEAAPADLAFAGQAFTLEAYQDGTLLDGLVFAQPVMLTITYTEADIQNIDETGLTLYYWDEALSGWQDVANSCTPASVYDRHPAENWLAVEVCHLSRFSLFGDPQYHLSLPIVTNAP